MEYPRGPAETESALTRLGRWHWLYPVPAVALHAVTLLASRRIWTDIAVSTSRSGRASRAIVAHSSLYLVGFLVVAYYAIYFFGSVMLDLDWRAWLARSTPTDKGCALALLRGGLVIVLYAVVWSYARKYLFGGS